MKSTITKKNVNSVLTSKTSYKSSAFRSLCIATILVLSFVSVVSAADTVEIRSPVFNGSDLDNLDRYSTDYTDFAAFWYDIDEGLGSEAFTIVADLTPDNTIDEEFLVYTANVQDVDYTYEPWSAAPVPVADQTFQKLGFFGEEYVPVNGDPQILSTLIMDDDEKYTLRVGQTLELGEGFALTLKQIDVDGNKVWLEFTKDGEFLDDDVYDATPGTDTNPDHKSWDYEADLAGEEDVVVLRVHVNEVFRGQVDSLAIIEGLWLIDDEPLEIADDEEFGKFEVFSTTADSIILKTTEDINLGKDDLIDVTDTIKIQTADSDDLRFYFFEELTEPGDYEIRGTIASPSGAGSQVWDYRSFAGFFYDLDDNLASETLNITWGDDNRTVLEDTGVVYTATMQPIDYEYEGWVNTSTPNYVKMGFLAEEYVPINNDPQILSTLIMDDDGTYTLRVGQSLDMGEGFKLTLKQIDVEGDKVWLELSKDGKFLDDEVYNTLNNNPSTSWEYDIDVAGEDDVVIMRVHVNEVFQGQVDSLAIIEGLWLISDEPLVIADDEKFGMLEVETTTYTSITLVNSDEEFDLGADDVFELTETISIRVADSDDANVRFYPFIVYNVIIENEIPTANIISILPNIADVGDLVVFFGTGTDTDGSITAYLWTSDLDGQLSSSENFSTSGLSIGTHTVYFRVQDDDGAWSATDSTTVTINEKPNVAPIAEIVSIDPSTATEGIEITFNGSGTDSDGTIISYDWNSSIDGQLSTIENFSTSILSLGNHTVYFRVQDDDGAWSDTDSAIVAVIDDLAPEVHISAYPLEYISIYNPVTINLNSTDAHLAATELIITDSEGHEIINLTIAKDEPTSATYEYAWNAIFSNETAVPSGTYLLFVNSTDTSGNEASASVSVTVDNRAPLLYIIGSEYNATYGMVNISASELLNGTPEVDVNSESISVTSNDHGWSGIFNLNSNDVFAINVTAYDFAGNVGVGNSTIHIETIETVNNTAVFNSSDSGISIIFRTTNETNSTVIVTESDQLMANIINGSVGIYFIDVDLGSGLENNLSNATIMIPINVTKLLSGISENDVAIYYYNETNDNWESIDTSIELIDGIKYWVAHVDHFSIYAAIAEITSSSSDGSNDNNNSNGGNGGGGGGGGATGEAFENIAFKEVKTENIIGGLEISYTFDEEQNAIQYINFSALRNYGRVSTTIEVLKNRSAMVDESAPGVVYSNLNIWVGRAGFATEDNIADSAIGFSVAKAWLIENGIDENSITLYRHSEGKWNALNTMKIGEDDSYIYFETETPGFSPFAIVGFAEEDESVSIEDITPSSEEDISEVEDEDTQTEPKGIPWISTGSLILILVGVHLLMRKRS